MPKTNHRRKNRKPVNDRYEESAYNNGYAGSKDTGDAVRKNQRTGSSGFLDKSMHSWGTKLSGAAQEATGNKFIGAGIGNDFTDGHRGMARSVKGAKKFVRTRVRFHENAATKKLALERDADDTK